MNNSRYGYSLNHLQQSSSSLFLIGDSWFMTVALTLVVVTHHLVSLTPENKILSNTLTKFAELLNQVNHSL